MKKEGGRVRARVTRGGTHRIGKTRIGDSREKHEGWRWKDEGVNSVCIMPLCSLECEA